MSHQPTPREPHVPGYQPILGQPHAPQRPHEMPPARDPRSAESPPEGAAGAGVSGPDRFSAQHRLDDSDHELRQSFDRVRTEVAKAVVGQNHAVDGIITALLCDGHVLLEGVPGVAKTLLVRTISRALSLRSARIQFTPDLMPGDVTGSMMYNAQDSSFEFRRGPIFTNLLIADEINRTPPKTQSALLEAMEEHQTSVDGHTYSLPEPFLVAATQNPVEYEGTYSLPEAQLDRFLFKIVLGLPARNTEFEILQRHAAGFSAHDLEGSGVSAALGCDEIARAKERIARIHCADEVVAYIVDLVQATRQAPSLELGVSPRCATRMLSAARVRAWLRGRAFITPDDVKALIHQTFRHRIMLRPEAHMDGIGVEQVIDSIVSTVPVPR